MLKTRLKSEKEKTFLSEDKSVRTQTACLNRIFRKVNIDGLSAEAMEELGDDMDYIGGCYNITPESTALLAAILEKSATGNKMDEEDLADYLGCTNIEFIRYHGALREMERAGIIQCRTRMGNRVFRVSPEALKAIEEDCAFTPIPVTGLATDEIFSRFRKIFQAFRDDTLDPDSVLEEAEALVKNNPELVFCKKVLDSPLYGECSRTERRMFFYLCHRYVTHGEKSVPIETLINFVDQLEDDEFLKRRIARERMPMQQSGLVTFAMEDGFADTDSLSLSRKVQEEFFSEIELAPEDRVCHRDVVSAESIQPKELFFNADENAQVTRLAGLLDEENFKEVQSRLTSCGMRKGFNVIFYGAPGTGKTASVYELARRTGRDIFRIDMSKLKSKWVGESEKSVKGVFNIYRALCKTSKKAPILLFNEADAIFTRRIENVEHSVDQMNNAIQNIILDEMENLEGVLIATTNLLSNLDPAFERRFIYKVEFKLPEKDCRAKIWRSMIGALSEEDAETLAGKYPFSGGNIENIARKSTVEYVLSGNPPTLASLETACESELLNKDRHTRIGF